MRNKLKKVFKEVSDKLYDTYIGLKLHQKLFLFSAIFMSIAFLLGSYLFYSVSTKNANDQLINSVHSTLNYISYDFENKLTYFEDRVTSFSMMNAVNKEILRSKSDKAIDQYESFINLRNIIRTMQINHTGFNIRIFFPEKIGFLNDNVYFYLYEDMNLPEHEIQKILFERGVHWLPSTYRRNAAWQVDEYVIPCMTAIIDREESNEPIAIVSIEISVNKLAEALKENYTFSGEQTDIIYNYESLIYQTGLIDYVENGLDNSQNQTLEVKNEDDRLVIVKEISRRPFSLITSIPMMEIEKLSRIMLNGYIPIILSTLLVIYITLYILAKNITRRLNKTIDAMSSVGRGDFKTQIEVESNDEISKLQRSFNSMTEQTNRLIEDVYKAEIQKRKAQLELFQAQINPHFLYNILDAISWLAIKNSAYDINVLVKNLSNFLRLSMNINNELVYFSEELRHAEAYFRLQNFRFEDRISLRINIDNKLYKCKVLPIIIQPLIENAIDHGILAEKDRKGIIHINGQLNDNSVIIEVKDDGIGFKEEDERRINLLLQDEVNIDLSGEKNDLSKNETFGLYSIHKRIQLHYGDDYGINVLSEYGKGTSIILIFPYQ